MSDPHPGNSGPGGPFDERPQFSPDLLVLAVLALLDDEGIQLDLTRGQRRVAVMQAGTLLETLGVAPIPLRLNVPGIGGGP